MELVQHQGSSGRSRCKEAALTQHSISWLPSGQWPPLVTALERFSLRAPARLHMPWFSALTFLSAASDLVTATAKFQVLSRSRSRQNSRQAELPWLAVCRGVQRTPEHRPKQFGAGCTWTTQWSMCLDAFCLFSNAIRWMSGVTTSFMFIYYKTKEQNVRENWGGRQATAEKPHGSCVLAQQGHTLHSAPPLGHLYPKWKPRLSDQKAPLNWLGYWLQNFFNSKYSNSRESYALFWPLWAPGTQVV